MRYVFLTLRGLMLVMAALICLGLCAGIGNGHPFYKDVGTGIAGSYMSFGLLGLGLMRYRKIGLDGRRHFLPLWQIAVQVLLSPFYGLVLLPLTLYCLNGQIAISALVPG